jgi:hypothetical protein
VRFLERGADIPDELIRAVTNGSAMFLCGAGVSFRVGLPSFKELTERIYARLGESPDDEAAERNAIASNDVLQVKASGHRELVSLVGHAAAISAGEWVTATGNWVNDRTHGQQFQPGSSRPPRPPWASRSISPRG